MMSYVVIYTPVLLCMCYCHVYTHIIIYNTIMLLGERSEPHTGVFNRDFALYIYICACVCRGPKSVGGITWAKRAHAQSDL